MTRDEIKARFRAEVPEVTTRVISEGTLNNWCLVGDKEVATRARLIKAEETFSATVGERGYNLSNEIDKFYDIDIFPGGGPLYNNQALNQTTPAWLNENISEWRSLSNGTPDYWYRLNQYLYFERAPNAANDIFVPAVIFPDDFNDDDKTPFNQLTHLEPFHYSLVLYLIMRAKRKIGKGEEKREAMAEYNDYVQWMKNEVNRGIYHAVHLKAKTSYTGRRRVSRGR